MSEKDKGPTPLLCIGCGKPSTKGEFCRECLDRGLGPCEACEGNNCKCKARGG
jgi:hypothetical protein